MDGYPANCPPFHFEPAGQRRFSVEADEPVPSHGDGRVRQPGNRPGSHEEYEISGLGGESRAAFPASPWSFSINRTLVRLSNHFVLNLPLPGETGLGFAEAVLHLDLDRGSCSVFLTLETHRHKPAWTRKS